MKPIVKVCLHSSDTTHNHNDITTEELSKLFYQKLNPSKASPNFTFSNFPDFNQTKPIKMSKEYENQDPIDIAKRAEQDLNSTANKQGGPPVRGAGDSTLVSYTTNTAN